MRLLPQHLFGIDRSIDGRSKRRRASKPPAPIIIAYPRLGFAFAARHPRLHWLTDTLARHTTHQTTKQQQPRQPRQRKGGEGRQGRAGRAGREGQRESAGAFGECVAEGGHALAAVSHSRSSHVNYGKAGRGAAHHPAARLGGKSDGGGVIG